MLLLPFYLLLILSLAKPNKTPEGKGALCYVHSGVKADHPKASRNTAVVEQLGFRSLECNKNAHPVNLEESREGDLFLGFGLMVGDVGKG